MTKNISVRKVLSNITTEMRFYIFYAITHRTDISKNKEVKCEECGSYESIELHHTKYEPEEQVTIDDLKLLCSKCHRNDNEIASETRTVFENDKRFCEMPQYKFEY